MIAKYYASKDPKLGTKKILLITGKIKNNNDWIRKIL